MGLLIEGGPFLLPAPVSQLRDCPGGSGPRFVAPTSPAATDGLERLFTLRELSAMGYGSRRANLDAIHAGRLPAVSVHGRLKVRESDLGLLAVPVTTTGEAA